MKQKILIVSLVTAITAVAAVANDSSYNGSGQNLYPVTENEISLTSELLIFTLRDSRNAHVSVDYTLTNHGPAKTILMGFESTDYNSDAVYTEGGDPNITDFTNTFNGQPLSYTARRVVDEQLLKDCPDCVPEDGDITYAYSFSARFEPGANRLHQEYDITFSNSVDYPSMLPYKLTPANRWANGCIDDFTIRIEVPQTEKHFYVLADSTLTCAAWCGEGTENRQWRTRTVGYESYPEGSDTVLQHRTALEAAVRGSAITANIKNYSPRSELTIRSAGRFGLNNCPSCPPADKYGAYYDRTDSWEGFYNEESDSRRKWISRVKRNLPYAGRGYIFHDPHLREYFESMFWYLPDPGYKPSEHDRFTQAELQNFISR